MKLKLRFKNYHDDIGGFTYRGTIAINPRLLFHPLVLASVVLHELTHWSLDAMGMYDSKLHDWSDLLYTYIGLYDRKVDRPSLREMVRSPEWDTLKREPWRVGGIR